MAEHNVYILGAGFSVAASVPPVRTFLFKMQAMEEQLRAQQRLKEADAIAEVMEFRLSASSAAYRVRIDLDNIEDLFSLASADANANLKTAIRWAIAATIDESQGVPTMTVRRTDPGAVLPAAWQQRANEKFEAPTYDVHVGALLSHFGPQNSQNTIITFNYDTLVEDALGRLGVDWTYGLSGHDLRAVQASPDGCIHPYGGGDELQVLKLHGSTNWASGGGARGAAGHAQLMPDYAAVLAHGNAPILVPPTWKKTFASVLQKIWDASVDALESATRVVIIGFSVPTTDAHFRFLLGAGLQKNIALREVTIVNPDEGGGVEQRVRALLSPRMTQRDQIRVFNGDDGFTTTFFRKPALLKAIGRDCRQWQIEWW